MTKVNKEAFQLSGRSLLLRDQDMLDMWIMDKKKSQEIADELGITKSYVNTRLSHFRKAGFKVPRRENFSDKWAKGQTIRRIVLKDGYAEKLTAAQKK